MPDWLVPGLGILVTLCLGILTWLATRRTGERARIEALEKRLDVLESRKGIGDDYIQALRKHIIDGKEPPPPPYPTGLFD